MVDLVGYDGLLLLLYCSDVMVFLAFIALSSNLV